MPLDPARDWSPQTTVGQRRFTCGHSRCGREVGSNIGMSNHNPSTGHMEGSIYVCPVCHYPTFFDDTVEPAIQTPGVSFGKHIDHLPTDVEQLYEEIRRTTSAESYTSAVLACRKLLMHIAVEKGAQQGQDFVTYVKYLADNHYSPPGSEPWVDKIRRSGNEANHEIVIKTRDEAQELVNFVEMLLTFIYEFPAKIGTLPPAPVPTPAG